MRSGDDSAHGRSGGKGGCGRKEVVQMQVQI